MTRDQYWLILQGRDTFEAAEKKPDTLAAVVNPDEEVFECEWYPAVQAWFAATKTKQDAAGYAAFGTAMNARHPDRTAYPELGKAGTSTTTPR